MGKTAPDWGNKYGKPDIERLGLFTEMPYMNGKGYVSPFGRTLPTFSHKPFALLVVFRTKAGKGQKPFGGRA